MDSGSHLHDELVWMDGDGDMRLGKDIKVAMSHKRLEVVEGYDQPGP